MVAVRKTQEGAEVEIESKLKAQLPDWGKHEKNVEKFFDALNKRLPKSS